MPIYEYRCEACGAPKEAIQKMSDPPLKVCEACGAEALQRVMSRTSFVLKGSGWYATDYKAPAKESKSESTSESTSASKTEAPKTEATKSEATKSEATKAEAPKPAPASSSDKG